ncbi:N-acetylmuramoyl-L-alanine amidase [Bacillus sp. FSL K6-1109]|uniref:N-acetylmuramoyl-L-alanine amidase n=3 Tax=Bacteria TaxID=2 RepID=A0AB37GIK9_BACLI|nr:MULTISPECIES: N-acetylmuramoyl-L-alanine amidase [Bacillus]MBJ7887931.1 N-acetylmuramoyl-L-alanine amidase [Bacillaceae bacterium HSR45]ATI75695.1 N-acetylmuramoyl-L-alanine amidase [Bacillus licheniformis]AYC51099.1 N-acetylmuramoyl-L-alanine amidase [Bacillus licheniformis]KAA0812320.1 N-acetylmuramoyl-L-alanine amidase [Bacillus licheniformis]KAA0827235.1 N-acetylmuramoyl-L-alanine amidase [Bacillus licheniformis]
MKKVWLDAGHGGTDPGASGYGLKEKDVVLKIVKYAKSYLEANYKNVQVKLTRSTDVFYELSKRASMANQWGADLFVSVHANAGGGTGFETFRYPGTAGKTLELQKALHNEILTTMKAYGQIADRGLKQANLAVVRETRMPAVLTENLFIDRKEDAERLKDSGFLKAVGEAHARGIAKYLGLSGGSSKQPATTAPKKKAPKKESAKKPAVKKYTLPTGIYKYKSPMMKGTAVRQIQEALAALYFYPDKEAKNNGIDGYYGPKTANAVKRFQLMHGLSADGIYGPKTKAKIEALLK